MAASQSTGAAPCPRHLVLAAAGTRWQCSQGAFAGFPGMCSSPQCQHDTSTLRVGASWASSTTGSTSVTSGGKGSSSSGSDTRHLFSGGGGRRERWSHREGEPLSVPPDYDLQAGHIDSVAYQELGDNP
jgi:hypothetical protein